MKRLLEGLEEGFALQGKKEVLSRANTIFKKLNEFGTLYAHAKDKKIKALGKKAFDTAGKWGRLVDDFED